LDEITARTAADNIEKTARIAADDVEATTRFNADTTLQANIYAEATTRANADLDEITARTNADSSIRSDVNALSATFTSTTGALTHTVAHNLNSAYVNFTVLVQRANGTYRNDIVSVEETNANTLTVYLTESAMIKVAVQAMKDI